MNKHAGAGVTVGEVIMPANGNGRLYVSWHNFLSMSAAGIAVILAGIFVIFSYIMHLHEQNPHNGSARHADILRVETRLNRMDKKTDDFREDTHRRLDALRDFMSARHTAKK